LQDQKHRNLFHTFRFVCIHLQVTLLLHRNPVEAGLVDRPEKYKYSSAGNYINNDHSIIRVDTSYAGTEHL